MPPQPVPNVRTIVAAPCSKLYPAYAEPLNAPLGGGTLDADTVPKPLNAPLGGGTSNANAQDSPLIAQSYTHEQGGCGEVTLRLLPSGSQSLTRHA